MLYTLSNSPYFFDLTALLSTVQKGDDLLLLADGVYAGLINSSMLNLLTSSPLKLFALENDITARGLSIYFSDKIIIINYIGFVKLTENQPQHIAW